MRVGRVDGTIKLEVELTLSGCKQLSKDMLKVSPEEIARIMGYKDSFINSFLEDVYREIPK